MLVLKKVLALVLVIMLFSTAAFAQTLREGDSGDAVARLQRSLRWLGYPLEEADGVYTEKTAKAVKQFQRQNVLDSTGIADDETQAVLNEIISAMLVRVQNRLKELGYYSGGVDGAYGPMTQTGLTQFQQANGIVPTGDLDDETMWLIDHGEALVDYATAEAQGLLVESTESEPTVEASTVDPEAQPTAEATENVDEAPVSEQAEGTTE